jgi:hypothetical protein
MGVFVFLENIAKPKTKNVFFLFFSFGASRNLSLTFFKAFMSVFVSVSVEPGMILIGAGLLGIVAILACLKKPAESVPPPPPEEKYCDKYPLTGERPVETEKNEAEKLVEDEVPTSGSVVLRALAQGEFEYWADKAVAYPNLEALARKWALVFDQREVFQERRRIFKAQAPVEVDPVFATLKTYTPRPVAVEEHANVYKWRGKLRDAPHKAAPQVLMPKTLRYDDYKRGETKKSA